MGNIFGKGGGEVDTKIANIDAGGLRTRGKHRIRTSASPERQRLVGNLAETFPKQAELLAGLRARVAPGASELRQSRLSGLESSRRRSVGDLRENLGRRRVLGSSFAQDAITRANLAFQEEGDRIRAESFMAELELTRRISEQEFAARRGQFETNLNEMNLQANIALQIATQATAEMNANARAEAQAQAAIAAGIGQAIGTGVGIAAGL